MSHELPSSREKEEHFLPLAPHPNWNTVRIHAHLDLHDFCLYYERLIAWVFFFFGSITISLWG